MIRPYFGFLFVILICCPQEIKAEEVYRRSVGFDWDAIPESKGYDMEIKLVKEDGTGKGFNFKIAENSWSGKLAPGNYIFRVRARDQRNVPGEWSAFNPFTVNLESIKIKSPIHQSTIKTKETERDTVRFTWDSLPGANFYKFELKSADGKTQVQKDVKDNQIELEIPVAMNYTWKVSGLSNSGILSDGVAIAEFTTLGAQLSPPKIKNPESRFVRQLTWKKSEYAEKYDLIFFHYNTTLNKWQKIKSVANYDSESMEFAADLPGGRWKVQVRARANSRATSDFSNLNFEAASGDRSPAAEYVATVRKSIDRIDGWYGTASYFVTMLEYQSLLKFDSAIGGTGRLGVGWMKEKSSWGFHSELDMSGFSADGENYTYNSFEASAIYRRQLRETDEIRYIGGLALKEIPVLLTPAEYNAKFTAIQNGSTYNQAISKVAALGPKLGVEYWHSLSPKLGIQGNAQAFYSLQETSLPPGGESVSPSLSYQMGLMGSYRLSNQWTGLVGVTYREDNFAYTDNYATTANQPAIPTTVTTIIKGYYLSFYTEYSF